MKYSRAVIICLGASLSFLSKSKYASQLSLKACCLSPMGSGGGVVLASQRGASCCALCDSPCLSLEEPQGMKRKLATFQVATAQDSACKHLCFVCSNFFNLFAF